MWKRAIPVATLLMGAFALLALVFLTTGRDPAQATAPASPPDLVGTVPQPESQEVPGDVERSRSGDEETDPIASSGQRDGVFALDEVFDNPECMFRPGGGPAAGIAAVVLPDESGGSRFKILDAQGTLFEGVLPFHPNKAYLGRSEDQSIVAGFGDIRLNSKVFREPDTPEPVRIYRDGALEYETPKARQFAVATDGSAFVTLEPGTEKTHFLRIRRFEPHSEREVDLGNLRLNSGNDVLYGVGFSSDRQDVKLSPSRWGRPLYFHPVDPASEPVAFWERDSDRREPSNAMIPNRFVGFNRKLDRDPETGWLQWRIWKETYEWVDGERLTTTQWSTRQWTDEWGEPGYAFLAHEGRYYVQKGSIVRVLHADTGELVFAYPTDKVMAVAKEFEGRKASDIQAHEYVAYHGRLMRQRLASLEFPDEVAYPMSPGSVYARDGELILYSSVLRGGPEDCRTVPSVEYSACERRAEYEHGARWTKVLDTFALEDLSMDSQPVRRIEYVRERSCARGDFVFQGLDLQGGTFRFRTANSTN